MSAIQEGGTAPTPSTFGTCFDEPFSPSLVSKGKNLVKFGFGSPAEPFESVHDARDPLILQNKAPRWHEQLQCWCLNFKGRVTVASVKNFQLVAAIEAHQNVPATTSQLQRPWEPPLHWTTRSLSLIYGNINKASNKITQPM
ncbi:hypothetical protein CsSME_00038596 [Camellia sinensis var. sinensis]